MQVQIGIQLSIYEKILIKFVNKCEEMAYHLLSLQDENEDFTPEEIKVMIEQEEEKIKF